MTVSNDAGSYLTELPPLAFTEKRMLKTTVILSLLRKKMPQHDEMGLFHQSRFRRWRLEHGLRRAEFGLRLQIANFIYSACTCIIIRKLLYLLLSKLLSSSLLRKILDIPKNNFLWSSTERLPKLPQRKRRHWAAQLTFIFTSRGRHDSLIVIFIPFIHTIPLLSMTHVDLQVSVPSWNWNYNRWTRL